MSLIPMGSLNLPVVFLEARMLGQPAAQAISQLGISVDAPDMNVAVFTKASGVLLVAGVGSYCAYRICTKYLGQKFVWMLMDSTRYDQLPGADFRFIHPSQIVCESDDEEVQDEEEEGDRNSESEFLSRVSESRPASEMSLSRLQKVRRSVRTHGLLGLHQPRTPRSGVLRREGGSVTGSTHSRQRRDFSPSAASDCSASLQIVWEDNGQQWDDEFAQNGAHLHSSSSRLRLPQFSHHEIPPNDHLESHGSYGDLCSVFDDVLSMTTREDQIEIHLGWAEGEDGYRENERDDEKIRMKIDSESINEASNPVLKKCMTDSKYMYQSVTVGSDFDGSECGSVLSGRSRMSRISQTRGLQRKAKKTAAHGLWNLSASKTSINQETSHSSNDPMTDSGLSSGLRSDEGISNDLSKSTKLFDSALGAELFSSDDEQVNSRLNDGIMKRNRIAVSGMKVKSRVNLDGSSNLSVASLEWFDDDGMRENSMQEENLLPGTSQPTPTRVIITGQEWDFDSQSSGSATSNTRSTENEWRLRRVQTSRRPTKTRDTMVFACERLQPHSKAFRKIQSLYTREGFRRVGDGCKGSENFLASFLSSAIYHDLPSMATLTHEELDRKLKSALKRYQALQRFVDFSQKLEDFCKFIDDDSLGPPFTQIEAFRLILLLKSIEIWERQMNGEMARFAWWKCEHPGEAVDRLWNEGIDQALFHLISWSFNVRFEIFATSPKMKSTRDPSPQHYTIGERRSMPIHFIQHENLFHPLYRVPDD